MKIEMGEWRMRNGEIAIVDSISKHILNPGTKSAFTYEVAWGHEPHSGNLIMWDIPTGERVPDGIAPHQDLIERIASQGGGEGGDK